MVVAGVNVFARHCSHPSSGVHVLGGFVLLVACECWLWPVATNATQTHGSREDCYLAYSWTLKTEAAYSFEMSAEFYRTTRCHILREITFVRNEPESGLSASMSQRHVALAWRHIGWKIGAATAEGEAGSHRSALLRLCKYLTSPFAQNRQQKTPSLSDIGI